MNYKIVLTACITIVSIFAINQIMWSQRLKKEVAAAIEHDREIRRVEVKLIRYEIDTITIAKPSLDSALLILGWK
jgi:hypothetical protein